ncbi:MAG: hypothetical protein WA323_16680 [Candidatus Nitrosopolaris sp.]
MRENESDAAAHKPPTGIFSWKKQVFDQKNMALLRKGGVGGACAASLVPSRFVSKTRCFLSFQKQHDYPRGVKVGLSQLQIGHL